MINVHKQSRLLKFSIKSGTGCYLTYGQKPDGRKIGIYVEADLPKIHRVRKLITEDVKSITIDVFGAYYNMYDDIPFERVEKLLFEVESVDHELLKEQFEVAVTEVIVAAEYLTLSILTDDLVEIELDKTDF